MKSQTTEAKGPILATKKSCIINGLRTTPNKPNNRTKQKAMQTKTGLDAEGDMGYGSECNSKHHHAVWHCIG